MDANKLLVGKKSYAFLNSVTKENVTIKADSERQAFTKLYEYTQSTGRINMGWNKIS